MKTKNVNTLQWNDCELHCNALEYIALRCNIHFNTMQFRQQNETWQCSREANTLVEHMRLLQYHCNKHHWGFLETLLLPKNGPLWKMLTQQKQLHKTRKKGSETGVNTSQGVAHQKVSSAIFSDQVKSGTFYITGQWGWVQNRIV